MAADIRPLDVGQIIDRAVAFWRSHWKVFFQLFIGFQLLQFSLLKAYQLVIYRIFPAMHGGTRLAELLQNDPVEGLRQVSIAGSGGMFAVIVTLTLSTVASVAACHYAYPRIVGTGAPQLGEAMRFGLSRLSVTLRTALVSYAWSLVMLLLFSLPGTAMFIGAALIQTAAIRIALLLFGSLALGLGMLLAALWFILRFVVLAQVLAAEKSDSALALFRRSGELTSGRVGDGLMGFVKVRLTVLITVVGLIITIVSVVTGIPALVIQVFYGNLLDPMRATPEAVPQALLIPAELLQSFISSIFAPIYVVFQTYFYVDMRVRREGLDLELKLEPTA